VARYVLLVAALALLAILASTLGAGPFWP